MSLYRKFQMRQYWILAMGLALGIALMTTTVSAQETPTGPWEIIANGYSFTVRFPEGTWTEGGTTGQIKAISWNAASKEFTFERWWPDNDPNKTQKYTGYVFSGVAHVCTQGTIYSTMAGQFRGSVGTGATASRMIYGWVARQCLIN